MEVIFGVIFHFIGGFASGSFYIPYKKVKGWAWESFWIVGGIFSWLIVPPLAAWLTIPNFTEIIKATDGHTIAHLFFWFALGNWRLNLWLGGALFRCIIRQYYYTGPVRGIWFNYSICLL
jgi:hypothetical protein